MQTQQSKPLSFFDNIHKSFFIHTTQDSSILNDLIPLISPFIYPPSHFQTPFSTSVHRFWQNFTDLSFRYFSTSYIKRQIKCPRNSQKPHILPQTISPNECSGQAGFLSLQSHTSTVFLSHTMLHWKLYRR